MKNPLSPRLTAFGRPVIAGGLLLLALGLLFRAHYRFGIVMGDSMVPTLAAGDILLVDKRAYDRAEPARGDIVLVRYSNGFVVKRIVGLPGEEVEVRHGNLYINGGPMKENHAIGAGYLDVEKGNLSEGDFATLGDNRGVASALAIHPIATKAEILGKVIRVLGKRIR